jgi:hypothetical protein
MNADALFDSVARQPEGALEVVTTTGRRFRVWGRQFIRVTDSDLVIVYPPSPDGPPTTGTPVWLRPAQVERVCPAVEAAA